MLDEKLLLELQAFVAKHHQPHALLHVKIIEDLTKTNRKPPHTLCVYVPTPDPEEEDEEDDSFARPQLELEEFIETNRKPTFPQVLFGFIDQTSASDIEIYKRAGIDRRHFSKIRSSSNYRPNKNTAVAFALALKLDQNDTDSLLRAAGYSLSENETFDLVIRFCLKKKIYNIDSVNQALDYFSLKPLGALT